MTATSSAVHTISSDTLSRSAGVPLRLHAWRSHRTRKLSQTIGSVESWSRSPLTMAILIPVLLLIVSPCNCQTVSASRVLRHSGFKEQPQSRLRGRNLQAVAATAAATRNSGSTVASNVARRWGKWIWGHDSSWNSSSGAAYSLNLRPFVDALPIPTTIDLTSAARNRLGKGESWPDVEIGAYRIEWVSALIALSRLRLPRCTIATRSHTNICGSGTPSRSQRTLKQCIQCSPIIADSSCTLPRHPPSWNVHAGSFPTVTVSPFPPP